MADIDAVWLINCYLFSSDDSIITRTFTKYHGIVSSYLMSFNYSLPILISTE